ncbi:MAG: VOC family protein [Pseudomonadota bacterium]
MALLAFDHVNLRTTRLEEMKEWYATVLGLHTGERPDFPFPGAWLYLGERAVVHLIGVSEADTPTPRLTLEHFAFRANDYKGFKQRLDDRGIPYRVGQVPGLPIVQVNVNDPDGNHIHIDFEIAAGP